MLFAKLQNLYRICNKGESGHLQGCFRGRSGRLEGSYNSSSNKVVLFSENDKAEGVVSMLRYRGTISGSNEEWNVTGL
ncbi:MAG TPA: hypothetical protein DIW30_04545 [Bacteroidales bacterium]|nr:hypothetical protein [Bacteroidales bacterium]